MPSYTIHYYLLLVVNAMLAMATENRGMLFTKYPDTKGIGKVIKTLFCASDICALSCVFDELCTSFNIMNDGKHTCQLLEVINGTATNETSTLYGKNHSTAGMHVNM